MKPEEFMVERSFCLDALSLNWLESSMDPRYMDFGEVEPSALHPYNTKRIVQ